MKKIATSLSNKLVEQKIIPAEEVDIYRYGFEILLSSGTTSLSIVILAFALNAPCWGILYLLISVPLKITAGGYHAPTYVRCFFLSNLSFVLILMAHYFFERTHAPLLLWFLVLFGSSLYIYSKAPVQHPNQPLSEAAITQNKAKAKIILLLDYLIVVLLAFFNPDSEIITFLCLTVLLVAVFIIPTQKKGGSHNEGTFTSCFRNCQKSRS